jgi:hypothetical protein
MTANALINLFLNSDSPPSAWKLIEASVHLPRRGKRWVASFRDVTSRQRWRSTGLTDRRAALILAQEWERAARQARAEQGEVGGDPILRLLRGTGQRGHGLTQKEVALRLGMSERGIRAVERRALEKLRRHPALRAIWGEWIGEGASGEDVELTDAEVAALYNLAGTQAERRVLDKLMALMAA